MTHWLDVEMSSRCGIALSLIAFIMGSVLENYMTCYLPPNFLTTNSNTIHTICTRGTALLGGFVGTSFYARYNCGMPYFRQCFQVDTTDTTGLGPSKSASISTLKTGNAPVVLHGSWAAVITYHQVTLTLICLVFLNKKNDYMKWSRS